MTLQTVYDEVIIHKGDNAFDIPHMGKEAIIREYGRLPGSIPCSEEAKRVMGEIDDLQEEGELEELADLLEESDDADTHGKT